jgi:nucleotide-binding universal stress UspA family protein
MPGIIVGVDGSGHSRRALEWAMKEAAVRHVPLTVLTVHPSIVGCSTAGQVVQHAHCPVTIVPHEDRN